MYIFAHVSRHYLWPHKASCRNARILTLFFCRRFDGTFPLYFRDSVQALITNDSGMCLARNHSLYLRRFLTTKRANEIAIFLVLFRHVILSRRCNHYERPEQSGQTPAFQTDPIPTRSMLEAGSHRGRKISRRPAERSRCGRRRYRRAKIVERDRAFRCTRAEILDCAPA
jgi:hypothetical protein